MGKDIIMDLLKLSIKKQVYIQLKVLYTLCICSPNLKICDIAKKKLVLYIILVVQKMCLILLYKLLMHYWVLCCKQQQ